MFMISPCAGCDTPALARILAIIEAVSGIITIIKSAWWYFKFKAPSAKRRRCQINKSQDSEDPANADNAYPHYQGPHPDQEDAESDTESVSSLVAEASANNILWTITGLVMGSLNIALGLFLLIGLFSVNYVFLLGWCVTFPLLYLLDCVLFTFLLKHCTSKERFERCRSHYISSTIFSFVFNSYVLWVGISVMTWCNCRRDPYKCRFQRDYCHSFNLSFLSESYNAKEDPNGPGLGETFYDLGQFYQYSSLDAVSF